VEKEGTNKKRIKRGAGRRDEMGKKRMKERAQKDKVKGGREGKE
jgi:hypothetical protein